ncbi:methyl-accepting chemotaxis protein [Rhodopseudomonas palustris]|uniref:methyl-accepting chemotaxis protein n=1 Tax=Rhodopseudomonas palustris TaxID=1076 RepID=UPI000641B102|nr:methyl-accepting chemotaxis protein [Rhodopseudomonas palustris]
MSSLKHPIADAVASIELVASRIEASFAQVGGQLGEGHGIFQGLNEALADLARELSSAQIEGASGALRDIAGRLNSLADALPAESALLDQLRRNVAEAGSLLKQLLKHVEMITTIARSARIESASLEGDREGFIAFTREAYELGKAVQASIEACVRDQQLLAAAVETTWGRQSEFERRNRPQLGASGTALMTAFADLGRQRNDSVGVAELAGSSARTISEVVGRSIVSLQAGDSTRQRLEHVCEGLRRAAVPEPSLVPEIGEAGALPQLLVHLEAVQLRDAQQEFNSDIGDVVRALSTILAEVATLVEKGRSLHGGREGGSSSFLFQVRQTLAQASSLIGMCEDGGRSIDEALSVVENTLERFRDAIANLSDSVVDISLIGMNAGLRAGHLGAKGRAFVVIAHEMKVTADQMTGAASRLRPLLSEIGKVGDDLRKTRESSDPATLSGMEASILQTLQHVEAGNERLGGLIGRLIDEGAKFDAVMNGAREQMTSLESSASALPAVAKDLEQAGGDLGRTAVGPHDEAVLDELYARYTMERERDVHRRFLQQFGLAAKQQAPVASDCDFELF